jgi:NDP-sugar pyrophosphorylase family protein
VQAIILAGGKGERLYPYSATLPKPLMPLVDMPVLEILLRQLRRYEVTDVILAVSHLGHLINAYFGDGERFGLRISYSFEEEPLGTAGPIAKVIDHMADNFIVANGDLLTTLDIATFSEAHLRSGAEATIGVFEKEWRIDFGLIEADKDLAFRDYREKPAQTHLVSMGIYALKRQAVKEHLEPGVRLDMPDLMLRFRDAGKSVRCHLADGYWLDIGRPEDFALAQQLFAAERDRFLGPKESGAT